MISQLIDLRTARKAAKQAAWFVGAFTTLALSALLLLLVSQQWPESTIGSWAAEALDFANMQITGSDKGILLAMVVGGCVVELAILAAIRYFGRSSLE